MSNIRTDITHVDCIPARATTVIHSFKRVLETAFMGCAGQILTHDNYLSSVRVRGPLTVQQYSVLAGIKETDGGVNLWNGASWE